MRFTRPKLSRTIAALAVMAILLGLGFWQLDRLGQKRDLILKIAERAISEPVPAPGFSEPGDIDFEFRRATATGTFRHDLEIPVYAIGPGGAPGYRIYTPLERNSGGVILVNRGWVPTALKGRALRAEGLPPGVVTVVGILRHPGAKARFTPENQPQTNAWFWLDLDLAADARGLENLAYYFIEAAADPDSPGPPRGATSAPYIANNHLGYMLTWFSLALALAVIFAIFHRRKDD
ncbi:MAG: SURF1 family protein [Proteobacteria bacterium]|nr:SURF1 family protein [Pseudomonadota bacterium]